MRMQIGSISRCALNDAEAIGFSWIRITSAAHADEASLALRYL